MRRVQAGDQGEERGGVGAELAQWVSFGHVAFRITVIGLLDYDWFTVSGLLDYDWFTVSG